MSRTPMPLPSINSAVLAIWLGNTVDIRCGQIFSLGNRAIQAMATIGAATIAATTMPPISQYRDVPWETL